MNYQEVKEAVLQLTPAEREALIEEIRELARTSLQPTTDEDLDPKESFRRGWQDIKAGRVMSSEEFHRRMLADDD